MFVKISTNIALSEQATKSSKLDHFNIFNFLGSKYRQRHCNQVLSEVVVYTERERKSAGSAKASGREPKSCFGPSFQL